MDKKILLHSCCGPCTIYPLTSLREQGYEVTALFHNPNIHPFREFRKRLETFHEFAEKQDLTTIIDNHYGLQDFLRGIVFRERQRCRFCYHNRLLKSAAVAEEWGFSCFSTTLLYSRYQNHQLIKELGELIARERGLDFFYEDFRGGWQQGVDASRSAKMYRQPYCGCIYSEQERYDKLHNRT